MLSDMVFMQFLISQNKTIAHLNFNRINNVTEYEVCVKELRAAIEGKKKGMEGLEMYGNSVLVIYYLKGG